MTARRCKDCPDGTNRPAPHPGPRCATHHREKRKMDRDTAHERRVQQVYGLRPGEYDKLYVYQGGRCAICRRARGIAKRLAVDHDHSLGNGRDAVRGLCCGPCNQMLGHGHDDPEFFERAAEYLRNPPARDVLD